jgi:hypothetical protein
MLVHTVHDTATLTGSVGTNIAGATLEVHVKRPDGTVVNRSAAAVDAAAGTWTSTLQAGDLDQTGYHYLEVQVTFSGGAVQSFALDAQGRETYFFVRNEYA